MALAKSHQHKIIEALLIARIINPQTSLSANRWWQALTIPGRLSIEDADVDKTYEALDWLLNKHLFFNSGTR